jgi:divalent metal cation (Fe/Co/Zn/Cd) transporter
MLSRSLIRGFSKKKDKNLTIIRREIIADIIQICLKLGAYRLSHSQAVGAELMRAGIDASNHVLMLIINKLTKSKPDKQYNSGNYQ